MNSRTSILLSLPGSKNLVPRQDRRRIRRGADPSRMGFRAPSYSSFIQADIDDDPAERIL